MDAETQSFYQGGETGNGMRIYTKFIMNADEYTMWKVGEEKQSSGIASEPKRKKYIYLSKNNYLRTWHIFLMAGTLHQTTPTAK